MPPTLRSSIACVAGSSSSGVIGQLVPEVAGFSPSGITDASASGIAGS